MDKTQEPPVTGNRIKWCIHALKLQIHLNFPASISCWSILARQIFDSSNQVLSFYWVIEQKTVIGLALLQHWPESLFLVTPLKHYYWFESHYKVCCISLQMASHYKSYEYLIIILKAYMQIHNKCFFDRLIKRRGRLTIFANFVMFCFEIYLVPFQLKMLLIQQEKFVASWMKVFWICK